MFSACFNKRHIISLAQKNLRKIVLSCVISSICLEKSFVLFIIFWWIFSVCASARRRRRSVFTSSRFPNSFRCVVMSERANKHLYQGEKKVGKMVFRYQPRKKSRCFDHNFFKTEKNEGLKKFSLSKVFVHMRNFCSRSKGIAV